MPDTDARLARLERANRRLTLALVGACGLGAGAVLAGFGQPGTAPEPAPAYVGLAVHDEVGYMYRLRADGGLERISLKRGRVTGGGTPAEWNEFPVGVSTP